ncbi:MAG TPA: hypothetical protein PKY88_05100 [Anaerohalosphaeraceae bacterium]|nr:hypothetical protein [Anaerohalosphaeraceae bacterium]
MSGFLRILLIAAGGLLFAAGLAAYVYVRLKLKPKWHEIEETYYEIEEAHPAMRRYQRGLQISMALIAAAMLLLFLGAVL